MRKGFLQQGNQETKDLIRELLEWIGATALGHSADSEQICFPSSNKTPAEVSYIMNAAPPVPLRIGCAMRREIEDH
jgi:hypothetical protein